MVELSGSIFDRYRVKGGPQPPAEPEDTELATSLQALEIEQPSWCAGQQQTALWELVTTEAAYIRNLQVSQFITPFQVKYLLFIKIN